jgi:hypothetical protein
LVLVTVGVGVGVGVGARNDAGQCREAFCNLELGIRRLCTVRKPMSRPNFTLCI